MTSRVKKLRCGPVLSSPSASEDKIIKVVDCGAMISSRLLAQLEDMLQQAEKQGARILVGGKRYIHPDWPEGHYFQPTLIADVKPEMDIAKNECELPVQFILDDSLSVLPVTIVFAPVMNVIPFDTVEQAIDIANGTRYGLGSAIFGNDRAECRSVAERLEVGMVAINELVHVEDAFERRD